MKSFELAISLDNTFCMLKPAGNCIYRKGCHPLCESDGEKILARDSVGTSLFVSFR